MRILRDINSLPDFKNAVITIGSFDGVHVGHQKIIKRIKHLAKEIDGESVIITFHPHPREVIYPKDNTLELLNTIDEKISLCKKFGIDNLVIVPFSIEFSQQHPKEYVEKFLLQKFNPEYIVIGYDHKFGLNREGDIHLLKEYESNGAFKVIQIKKQEIEDITISSTKIRKALKNGDIEEANQFLNYNYRISGKVAHGEKIGNKIGFPTANIDIPNKNKLIPAIGVYAVNVSIEGLKKQGMMYIGSRPTVNEDARDVKVEVNIFDFDDRIYDKEICIEILHHIRGDMKFDSLEELRLQLERDKKDVLQSFIKDHQIEMNENKICVAILNYNGLEYLESYLPQVLYSYSDNFSIAVIDNASTDESAAYIQEWHPEVDLIQLSKNYGFAEGYNRGMEDIHAQYTVILNSDVSVTHNWLDPLINFLDNHPEVAAVQPKILSLEEKDYFEYAGASGGYLDTLGYPYCRGRIFDTVEKDEHQYDAIENVDWASGAAMVVRTKVFKDLGGFDEDYFAHMEEIDFCWRIRKAGYQIKVLPESVVYHLGGGTLDYGNPRKVMLNFRNSLYTIYKNESPSTLFWLLPLRLILDGVAGFKFLLEGKTKSISAIIDAHWTFFGKYSLLKRKKNHYNHLINKFKIGPELTSKNSVFSIVLSYYLKGKKTFSQLR